MTNNIKQNPQPLVVLALIAITLIVLKCVGI